MDSPTSALQRRRTLLGVLGKEAKKKKPPSLREGGELSLYGPELAGLRVLELRLERPERSVFCDHPASNVVTQNCGVKAQEAPAPNGSPPFHSPIPWFFPFALGLKSREMEEVLQKALRVMGSDNRKVPMRQKVRQVVEDYRLDVADLDSFTQEVIEEAARRSLKALRGAWASLGIPPASPEAKEAERRAVEGERVKVWYPVFWGAGVAKPVVGVLGSREVFIHSGLPEFKVGSEGWFEFRIEVCCGSVEAEVRTHAPGGHRKGGLFLKGETLYLEALSLKELKAISKGVNHLIPFFTAIGFEGPEGRLEGALERLSALKRGEAGIEGEYLLARKPSRLLALRGSLLGDSLLDVAFLTEGRATLFFPHGLEVSLVGHLANRALVIERADFRWGEDAVQVEWHTPLHSSVMDRDPLGIEIKNLALVALYDPTRKLPPRMRALFQTLGNHPEPLKALRSGEFYPQTVAEVFIDLF